MVRLIFITLKDLSVGGDLLKMQAETHSLHEVLMEIFQIYTLKKASLPYEHPVSHQITAFKTYPPLKERCFQKICM